MITADQKLCEHCGSCAAVCPNKSIVVALIKAELALAVNNKTCIDCGKCVRVCPVRALAQKRQKNT